MIFSMRTTDSPLRRRIREAANALNMKGSQASLAASVQSLTTRVLSDWNAVSVPTGGAFGLESLGDVVPTRNTAFEAMRDGDPAKLMHGLKELGMAHRHIEQVAEQCISLFDGKTYNVSSILRNNHEVQGAHAPLSAVVGRTAAAQLTNFNDTVGTEAFGDDINRLATDDRLTMDLMIMRPWENIMDKALARVTESSPVVTIRVPSPEAWDWATTQQANSTAASRNGSGNTYRLRDLYRNPTPVNSQPKRVVALTANDSGNVLWNSTTNFYKTGKDVSLLDLSRNAAAFTYDHVDRTDLISDGGVIDNVIVTITNPNGGSPVVEHFIVNTRPFDLAMFVITPTNKASGQRQVIMEAVLPISTATKQYDGTTNSTIAAALTDAKIQVRVRINATLNIQTGMMQASGTVQMELKQLASGVAISGATNTLFGTLTAQLSAYSAELYFDEENQRKANLAVWVQYYETQFVVPRSRIYFTEYSLSQDVDENAVAATSSIVALGNGRRGLGIVVNALNDISQGLKYVAANPEIAAANAMDEQSFASALVKPTVITTTLNFGTEELNTMNESTRLTEIHGRFRARFLSMITLLFAKSLMLNQYKGGEVPVIKAWVHSTIADLVIGILDYHPELADRNSTATGADYSMLLPNGYRLDVIKSNLDCLQNRIYAVPVIESDMGSILSAASIRDCGTVTTNYTPSNNGSVVRRVATSTREIVMMSNKIGVCLNVVGLATQLGTTSYDPILLSQDFSDSLTI